MKSDKWIRRMAEAHGMIVPYGGKSEMSKLYSIVNACASPHAGGPESKGKKAANVTVDDGSQATGIDGVSPAASGDDDDGDGDGDPDSDRRNLNRPSKSSRTAQIQRPPQNRILRMPILRDKVGLSRSTIYELISKGEFPPSITLGPRAVGWLESDIDAWVESRINASQSI